MSRAAMSDTRSADARDVADVLAGRKDIARVSASHAAFARIYDRHAPVVRAVCFHLLRDTSESDDALQETFIRAHRMLDRVEDPDRLRTWLYAIARNVCAERRRAGERRARHERGASASARSPSETPLERAERGEMLEGVNRAMESLPEDERLALHMYYLDPDPVSAARDALGVSRSGFYKLLTRARERLAGLLNPNASERHAP